MNYKINKNELISRFSHIQIQDDAGHLKVRISYKDGIYYKFNITQKTSIKSNLTLFEKKVVLIHMYKLLDRFKTNPNGLKQEVNTNYAGIFGSCWH